MWTKFKYISVRLTVIWGFGRLTHLVIKVCVHYPLFEIDHSHDQQLVDLFQRCSHLEALQLESLYEIEVSEKGKILLSHFP